jgi:two-component system, OmpR family, alkaline phosphatase synthesis response regulator PhoP
MEVRVLALFFQKEVRPIHRTELLRSVWGYSSDTETRTLDNFIVRLRKYFEPDPSHPKHFQTVRAVGYRFSRTGE